MKQLMIWLGVRNDLKEIHSISKELSTVLMSILILLYALISDLLRGSSVSINNPSFIVVLMIALVIVMIKNKLLVMGQFLLIFTGLMNGFVSFPYNTSFHFYAQMALVLIIGAIIHVRPYQMWFVNIMVNGLVILRTVYLYQLDINEPLPHNIFEQSIFVLCGIVALTLMVNRFIKIIDNEAYETKVLKGIADLDLLTGLSNRLKYNKEMTTIYNANLPLHLAVIDIDDFKHINDKFGHDVGDYVLISLSNHLKQWFGEDCFQIFRWGGEEFTIIAYDIDIKDFMAKLEYFRMMFMKIVFPFNSSVTISIGVATRIDFEKPELTFVHADQALYEAKHSGKNKLKYWETSNGEIV